MRQADFVVDGKTVSAPLVRTDEGVWIHWRGETHFVALGRERGGSRKRGAVAANPNEITAPMPGKVIRVVVSQGQEVKSGDSVLVLEAMKMEYTLKAARDGLVKEVCCAVAGQVSSGQILVRLEPISRMGDT